MCWVEAMLHAMGRGRTAMQAARQVHGTGIYCNTGTGLSTKNDDGLPQAEISGICPRDLDSGHSTRMPYVMLAWQFQPLLLLLGDAHVYYLDHGSG